MWSYELHPPHLINDDTLLCESRKPKMHVNTTSGFKFNYKIAVTCIKLHWQFHKMFWWIITNIHARAFVQSVHQQHAHMISDGHASIDDIPVKVKTSLQQHLCRSSMSWVFVSCTLWCITPIQGNFRHMMTLVQFDEAMIYSWCSFLW